MFEATHRVTLDLIDEGVIDGLRVDHPDGLADPRGYLRRLRQFTDVPVWVEKIVIGRERLPADWPCEGTTGYEALNAITRLFVDPAGADKLIKTFTQRTGVSADYDAVRYEAKKYVLSLFFKGEVDRLESAARRAWPARRAGRDAGRDAGLPGLREPGRTALGRGDPARSRPPPPKRAAAPTPAPSPGWPTRSCTAPTRPSPASSRRAGRSWPRAWRTPPSTAGSRWPASTRSAANPTTSRSPRRSSTPSAP